MHMCKKVSFLSHDGRNYRKMSFVTITKIQRRNGKPSSSRENGSLRLKEEQKAEREVNQNGAAQKPSLFWEMEAAACRKLSIQPDNRIRIEENSGDTHKTTKLSTTYDYTKLTRTFKTFRFLPN